uniref:UBX domain-containing protein n=1 Tax=Strigamia maritima TaxID=126957 RepID=T1J6F2_STRMM
MSDFDHTSGERSVLSHICLVILETCGLSDLFNWETPDGSDEFHLKILQTLLIVLCFNICFACIAWKVYGPRIVDRFMKPMPSTLLEDLKQGAKFKLAGQGKKLGNTSESTSQPRQTSHQRAGSSKPTKMTDEAKRAGAAALARFDQHQSSIPTMANRSQTVIRNEAMKELALEKSSGVARPGGVKVSAQDSAPVLALNGVYFKCPVATTDVLPEAEIREKIRVFLFEQLNDDKEVTPCYMIHTLNKRDKIDVCVKTLEKYLENILEKPDEEKFQKIRINNRAFQEKVAGLLGVKEFLLASGFELTQIPPSEDSPPEDYYVFNISRLSDARRLLDILLATEPIVPELDRDIKVYAPSENSITSISLSPDFYNITADEVKHEQKLKSEDTERNLMLRTKAMRERDEIRELRRYKYTLIRIRFPDGVILQGTFSVHDKLESVQNFVLSSLVNDWQPFNLTTSTGQKLTESQKSLLELHLVPAVIIHFAWDPEVALDLRRETGVESNTFLNDEMLQLLEELKVTTIMAAETKEGDVAQTLEEKSKPNDYRLTLPFAFQPVPLTALTDEMRSILSEALNKPTVTVSSQNFMRNFNGLAELIGFQYSEIKKASNSEDPTDYLLTEWTKQSGSSIGKLLELLNKIERYDILDDLKPLLTKNSSIAFLPTISSMEIETDETLEARNRARSFGLNYETRADWGAMCSRLKSPLAVSPVKIVFIHNTVWYNPDPIEGLKILQARKMIHYGHNDVPYNFFVCEDGRVFEGRGWDQGGSHTLRYNYVSLSIAMFGNYDEHEVTEAMMDATRTLIEYGVEIGKIDPNYGVYAHCDASVTSSPGKYTLEALKKFPRYHALGDLPASQTLLRSN